MIDEPKGEVVVRTRRQSNFDERLYGFGHPTGTALKPSGPIRSSQKCERYSEQELALGDWAGLSADQVIIWEQSTISTVRKELSEIAATKQAEFRQYQADIRAYWKQLLAAHPRKVVFYKKTSTMAFRKAKWVKLNTGHKVIFKTVKLKPRLVATHPKDTWDPQRKCWYWNGQTHWIMKTPRVKRALIVPTYIKMIVRPAGLRAVTVRTKVERDSYDFARIRPKYASYKLKRLAAFQAKVADLRAREGFLRAELAQLLNEPHRMVSYTEAGVVPPSWAEYYYQRSIKADSTVAGYDPVYAVLPLLEIGWFQFAQTILTRATVRDGGWVTHGWPTLAGRGLTFSPNATSFEAFKAYWTNVGWASSMSLEVPMEKPRTVIDRIVLRDTSTDQVDEQREALAAASVKTLRNRSDYVFNLPRSLGELKDTKGTYVQARDFLRWLLGHDSPRAFNSLCNTEGFWRMLGQTGRASLAFCSAYLAWKFAIQPTIQDAQTLLDQTQQWVLDTRRALRQTINSLSRVTSNILHIRQKFRGADHFVADSAGYDITEDDQDTVLVERCIWMRAGSCPSRVGTGDGVGDGYEEYEEFDFPGLTSPEESGLELVDPITQASFSEDGQGSAELQVSYNFHSDLTAEVDTEYHLPKYEGAIDLRGELRNKLSPADTMVSDYSSSGSVPLSPENQDFAEYFRRADWPAAKVKAYLRNRVEGVVFARYQLRELLDLLGLNDGSQTLTTLEAAAEKLSTMFDEIDRLYGDLAKTWTDTFHSTAQQNVEKLREFLGSLLSSDGLWIAWQLTPLSFLYDWFTTSDTIITTLNMLLVNIFVPAPPSLDGVWLTKRVELWAGRPELELVDCKQSFSVEEWVGRHVRYHGSGGAGEYCWAMPSKINLYSTMVYRPKKTIRLARTGLYAVKRGPWTSGGWDSFLPQVQVKLNAGKVATMLAMLSGFLGGKSS